jgi:small subunit ribosomal protein S20
VAGKWGFLSRKTNLYAAQYACEARSGQNQPVLEPGPGSFRSVLNFDPENGKQTMANTTQSKKRARQNERRFEINKMRRSRIRTYLRKVEEAIASGDKDAAATALRAAQPELMRGVTKGVFHKNTASRKMSRLASRVKSLG